MSAPNRRDLTLTQGDLKVSVSAQGASLLRTQWRGFPVLVPAGGPSGDAACFPLVPFGNRIAGNRFDFRERSYGLAPNSGDPLILHGSGWLADWNVVEAEEENVELRLSSVASACDPYAYDAFQQVSLSEDCLSLTLRVTNRGDVALPFGVGFHPFFRWTADLKVQMHTKALWSEGEGHLPKARQKVPADLDFVAPRAVPARWINNAFEGFGGKAQLYWPDIGLEVMLHCAPVFDVMMIHAAPESLAATGNDFVCLEPMSHLPDAHNMPDLGGLSILEPGEVLSGTIAMHFRADA
ncbi:aldose 1-epimerase [Labrenzia sp. OB1]|uniref:aldose 1-epimerase n=1 Tax=Labrenzia sp. OB1 TaxID=1561204 RepID=UPI0007B2632F|nr:aldose 1-epimerase [Labrenzia sp. OB1]KZM46942.1 hypothetical protein OA90_26640 [Labrenzia sp. OB1]